MILVADSKGRSGPSLSAYARRQIFAWCGPFELQREKVYGRTSAQFDQILRYPHEETLHPWLSKICLVKILIRLRECAGLFKSSLSANVLGTFSDVGGSFFTCH